LELAVVGEVAVGAHMGCGYVQRELRRNGYAAGLEEEDAGREGREGERGVEGAWEGAPGGNNLGAVAQLARQIRSEVGMIRSQEKLGCPVVRMAAGEDPNREYHQVVQ